MICVKELVKNFDDVCAVNNITLNIPEGEMLGLLGTNGAAFFHMEVVFLFCI